MGEPRKSIKKTLLQVTPQFIEEIEMLSKEGLNQTQIYNYFGVCSATWGKCLRKNPEVYEAYRRGKSKGISTVAKVLLSLAEKGNIEAIKFYLARVGKYSEAPQSESVEFEEAKPKKLEITVTDPIEAAKIYQQFMQGSSKK